MGNSAPQPWTISMDQLEGSYHHIAGAYLVRYAQERSWRGTTARLPKSEQVNRLAALSLKRGKSVDFGGYWQRHIERCSCLSKSFTLTKKSLKIMSGQYDETIFRFRVPGGLIYTHTIIRFGFFRFALRPDEKL
jgi:hypothetical protein